MASQNFDRREHRCAGKIYFWQHIFYPVIQIFLIDYGRSCFAHRSDLYQMPKAIAELASPLAYPCTSSGMFF